jgi:hypothetical protein
LTKPAATVNVENDPALAAKHLEEAFADAKIHKSSIVAMTKERLTIFFGRTRYDTIHDTNTLQHMYTCRHMPLRITQRNT